MQCMMVDMTEDSPGSQSVGDILSVDELTKSLHFCFRGYTHLLNWIFKFHLKPEAPWQQRSPECTAMKAIFSQNAVNVACKKN